MIKGDDMLCCEWHSQGYDHTFFVCLLWFDWNWHNVCLVTLHVLLSFFANHVEISFRKGNLLKSFQVGVSFPFWPFSLSMFFFLLCVFGFFVFVELVSIVPEFPSYCKPCDRNSVCWLVFDFNVGNWWNQWGCYGRWSMPCVLLLKVLHMHVTLAVIQSALHSILWSFFVFSLGWGFLCFMLAACCWFFCQIWNISDLIMWSSVNPFQVD